MSQHGRAVGNGLTCGLVGLLSSSEVFNLSTDCVWIVNCFKTEGIERVVDSVQQRTELLGRCIDRCVSGSQTLLDLLKTVDIGCQQRERDLVGIDPQSHDPCLLRFVHGDLFPGKLFHSFPEVAPFRLFFVFDRCLVVSMLQLTDLRPHVVIRPTRRIADLQAFVVAANFRRPIGHGCRPESPCQ